MGLVFEVFAFKDEKQWAQKYTDVNVNEIFHKYYTTKILIVYLWAYRILYKLIQQRSCFQPSIKEKDIPGLPNSFC